MDKGTTVQEAILLQKSEKYQGIDVWENGRLQKGQYIVQFDPRSEAKIVQSEKTVSNYFTDSKIIEQCKTSSGQIDARKYGELVQVFPKDHNGKNYQYPGNISIYQVKKEFEVACSKVEDNPLYGKGGGNQYYTNISKDELIKGGYLELAEVRETVNRDHEIGFLKEAEKQGKRDIEIIRDIPQKHNELVNEWLKGTQEQRERAMNIIGMEREYERLKEERGKGMEKQGSEIQHEPVVKSSEMEQNLSAQNLEKGIDASPLEVSAEKSGIEMEISGESSGLEIGGEGPSPGMETDGGMEMGMS